MKSRESKVRILIAKANFMTARLLAQALEKHPDLQVVATVQTRDALLASLQRYKPDVLLICVHLQDALFSGFTQMETIGRRFPDLSWVLLLDRTESQLIVDAFRAGAKGVFACSESDLRLLCKCVRCVARGEVWAGTAQVGYLVEALRAAPADSANPRNEALSLLTAREETVVRLVAQGLSNREIAENLGLSEHTVKNNLFHIFEKLGFSNRVELVLYAIARLNHAEFPCEVPVGTRDPQAGQRHEMACLAVGAAAPSR